MNFTVCFLLLCTLIGSCATLRCYKCSGDDCVDPLGTGTKKLVCPSDQSKCKASNSGGFFFRDCVSPESCPEVPYCQFYIGDKTCTYCCDGNLCNARSIADVVDESRYCYECAYSSRAPPSAAFIQGCSDEYFDPSAEWMRYKTCDGQCGVERTTFEISGVKMIERKCYSSTSDSGQCVAGCSGGTCTSCCDGNFCNGPVKPANVPGYEPANPDGGTTPGASLAVILPIALAPYVALCSVFQARQG